MRTKSIRMMILAAVLLAALFFAGVYYINKLILPKKIKALIVSGLEEATHKKVNIGSPELSVFKGLVLRDFRLYDDAQTFVEAREVSCRFMILPLVKKKFIISGIKIISPNIFLERRADNTFNLSDLFPEGQAKKKAGPEKLNILIYKLRIYNGRINFQDHALSPAFAASLDIPSAVVFLSLPSSVKFNFSANIAPKATGAQSVVAAKPRRPNISASGEYRISAKELNAQVVLRDIYPREFFAYLQGSGFSFPRGAVGAQLNLNLKDESLTADVLLGVRDLNISKDKVAANLSSDIEASFKYGLQDKELEYSGKAAVLHCDIRGLDFLDTVQDIAGKIEFNKSGISSQNLTAKILGVATEAAFKVDDFQNPVLDLSVSCNGIGLNTVKRLLRDNFAVNLPLDIQGSGDLSLNIKTNLPAAGPLQLSGRMDILNAKAKLEKFKADFDKIYGTVKFTGNSLEWSELNFQYQDVFYKTNGTLADFHSPALKFGLDSKELALESEIAIQGKKIKISSCDAKYKNSGFAVQGAVDVSAPDAPAVDLSGEMDADINDFAGFLKKYRRAIEKAQPAGLVHAKFSLGGNIKDIKSCTASLALTSPSFSLYGLKSQDLALNYSQAGGLADISRLYLSLYDGSIEATAKMNLNSDQLPFWVSADIKGIKIEKLKADTPAKDNDICGTLQAGFKLNGFAKEPERINGAGEVLVTDGKLWQLDLFKGLGELIFIKEFSNIVFTEGYAGFLIQDKQILSDSIKLKSNFVDITGACKIGFDSSLSASLNVQVQDEQVPVAGTFKDIATAIVGQAGKFGTIEISGTLQKPKYKFRTAVIDILKSLKDTLIGTISQ